MSSETLNYYEVLEVSPDASQELIYESYKSAQKTFSLQNTEIFQVFSKNEAKEWLDLIEEAYSVIGSPNTRRVYDQELKGVLSSRLPSFELSSEIEKRPDQKLQERPEGHGATHISTYPINEGMEKLIANQDVCDGLFLKKVREYKGIELTDFSNATCIAIRHLYAIENNNFSVLPAAVFVRGYVIQYCRVLDLDEERVVPSFMTLLRNGR